MLAMSSRNSHVRWQRSSKASGRSLMQRMEAFDLQPHLTGSLIEVRPLRRDDFDALYDAARDPLIWEQHPEPDRHERAVFQRYFDGAIDSGGAFAVIERASGRVIGSMTANEIGRAHV